MITDDKTVLARCQERMGRVLKAAINCQFASVLKFNPFHDDNGRFTSKAKAVHAGHKNKPTVSAMEEAMEKVGPEAFEAAVNEHLKGKGQLSPNRLASEIELVARQLIAKKSEYATVLKYNPYHGPDGKFTSHGSATFVSMRGKQYANVLTQGGKNTGAAETQLNKLGNLAHAFGKNYRAGMEGSAAFANTALDQMQLAANGAHTYGNHSQAYGEARQELRERIAQAFAKTGLPAAEKEGLGIPLTASEHAAIAAATLKAQAAAAKKEKAKLAKDFVNKNVETMLAAEAAQHQGDWAKHDQLYAEMFAAKEAIINAGGSYSEIYNLQDKAAQELVKVKDKHTEKFLAIAEEGVMAAKAGDHKTKEKLQKKALKYHKDHMGYLPFSGAQELVQQAKDTVNAKKQAALEAHLKISEGVMSNRATVQDHIASMEGLKKYGMTINEIATAEQAHHDKIKQEKAAKTLTGQAPVTAAGMADTLAKLGVAVPKTPQQEHADHIKTYLDTKAKALDTGEPEDIAKAKEAYTHYMASKDKLKAATGMEEAEALNMINDVKAGKYHGSGNQLPEAPAMKLASTMANPLNKDEAMHLAKAMGKQYYDLKAAGASQADLEAAHKLYDQAKDKYVEHGGQKDEFAAISTELKSQATHEYNTVHAAKKQAKQKAYNEVSTAATAWHEAVMTGAHPDDIAMYKKNMDKAMYNAEKDGHLSTAEYQGIHEFAKTNATAKVNDAKAIHKKAVVAATIKLHSAELAGDGNGMNEHALPFAHAVKDAQKYFSKEELTSIKDEAKAEADKQWETIKAFKEAVGNPHKVASAYDAKGDSFKYPSSDKALYQKFKDDQDAQIEQLTSSTRSVLKGYTGSEYTATNKAVGKYGTAKMSGLPAEPVPDYIKQRAEAMDAAFHQIKLGEDLRLRRNMPQKYFWNQLGIADHEMNDLSPEKLESMVGKVYKETAYGSASMNGSFTGAYSSEIDKTGGMILRIRAHKDINGLRLASISDHDTEEEVVLPRGTTYVIRSVKKVPVTGWGNKFSYEVEVDAIGMFPDKL